MCQELLKSVWSILIYMALTEWIERQPRSEQEQHLFGKINQIT